MAKLEFILGRAGAGKTETCLCAMCAKMERDILALMNKQSHKFSKGQRLIAQYISNNYDKAAFMTAKNSRRLPAARDNAVSRRRWRRQSRN